jgi:hypothetical protein
LSGALAERLFFYDDVLALLFSLLVLSVVLIRFKSSISSLKFNKIFPSQLSSDTSIVGGNCVMVVFSLTLAFILVFVVFFTRSTPHTIGLFSSSNWQENQLFVGSTHTSSSSHVTLSNYLARSLDKNYSLIDISCSDSLVSDVSLFKASFDAEEALKFILTAKLIL